MINDEHRHGDIEYLSFDEAFDGVKSQINKTLTSSPLIIREYTSHLTASQGKFIRALSLLSCAQDEWDLIHPDAVNFAAAIEILHLASLVHDDVMDDAKTRRGTISLQAKFGRRTAVICGDYLLCIALKMVTSVINRNDYIEVDLPNYMSRLALGELNQHINSYNINISLRQYFRIISGKTAALFEASFFAGALLCKNDEKELRKYKRLGHYIGMIFQLTDDLIDFEETEEQAKKPVQSDYEQGIYTLPLIYTMKNLEEFKDRLSREKIPRSELNFTVTKTGGLKFTRLISKKYYDKAFSIIKKLNLSSDKQKKLKAVLDKAYYGLKGSGNSI